MRIVLIRRVAIVAWALLAALPAQAQNRAEADRNDPAVIERELDPQEVPTRPRQRVEIAPPATGTAGDAGQDIVVGAIRVTGTDRVSMAAFAPAFEPYLGRPLAQSDLVRLATAVAGVMRRSGYGLATAWVPAQDMVGGILTVQVDEGRIDAVRASGPGARLVEQRLGALIAGGPVHTEELERQLMIIGDAAGLRVGEARVVRDGERNVLTLVTRYDRRYALVRLDNWGTSSVGPVRAWGEAGVNGLIRPGDEIMLGAATTPLDPSEFQFAEARYRLPVGRAGTMVGIGGYLGHTRSVGSVSGDMFEGDSAQVGVDIAHPISRSRRASLWATGRFELRHSRLDRDGVRVRDDRIATATASFYGLARLGTGRIRTRISLVQGLDLFGATREGDPLASREDAGGVFTKLELWGEYWRPLGNGFSLEFATRSQTANRPLLSSEEMGLGGPQFLRGFDYRERSGDQAVAASAELRFDLKKLPRPIENIQFYGYADAGRVRNLRSGGSASGLASAGGGARVTIVPRLQAGVEIGVPVSGGTRGGDPRFSFTITARF